MSIKEPGATELDAIRKAGLRPEVVGCFFNDNKLLFLFDDRYKVWGLPQGGIDNGEMPSAALNREMEEELGKDFVNKCDTCIVLGRCTLMGEDHIFFPASTKVEKVLKTDDGTEVPMKGKEYLFYAVQTQSQSLDIKKTEFERHSWLTHEKALQLADDMPQKGKQKITREAISLLKENKFI